MNFRLELQVKPFPNTIGIRDKVALMGSCFTEHIGSRLRNMKFSVLENPNGILFNPISIEQAIESYITCRRYTEADLFYFNELWTSWDFHGQFAHPDKQIALAKMNDSVDRAHHFLKNAQWLMVTLGSAFVYEIKDNSLAGTNGAVVANCHKVPANKFDHRLASLNEIEDSLHRWIDNLRAFNPAIQLIFTISPVRHYREGLVENNRSKGVLHMAIHNLLQQTESTSYFPSYELIIDDLRDYRFYAEDLVHPNHAATQYVWEKFSAACIDEESRLLMQQLDQLRIGMQHRPHHPESSPHQKFLASMYYKAKELQEKYPFLIFTEELAYFGANQG